MANTYVYKLQKLVDGSVTAGILFYHGENVSESITINSINFSIPGQSVDNNISMNLGGFTKLITFNFILEDRGTDVSDPTGDNEIIKLSEQWEYIMGNEGLVQDPGTGKVSEMQYRVTIGYKDSNGSFTTRVYTGMLEDIAIEPVEGEPRLRGRLTLNVSGNNPFITID